MTWFGIKIIKEEMDTEPVNNTVIPIVEPVKKTIVAPVKNIIIEPVKNAVSFSRVDDDSDEYEEY